MSSLFFQWQDHLSRKPDPNALPPGAAEALKEAEATIGNRLLKTQADYVAPPGHNTQLKVCLTRQEVRLVFTEICLNLYIYFREKFLSLNLMYFY